jgi:hypothetical protein
MVNHLQFFFKKKFFTKILLTQWQNFLQATCLIKKVWFLYCLFDLPPFSTLSLTITTKIRHFCKQNHPKTHPKNGQKTCGKGLFLHIFLKKTAFSVLGHLSFSIEHHLEPVRHGVAQVAQHGLIQGDPQLLELGL